MVYYIGALPVSPYLEHHGILGMKWGKRNGPPYPLDAEDHSKAEKKAGYKKSLGGGRNEELYNRKSDNQTKPSVTKQVESVSKPKHKMTPAEKEALKKKIYMGLAVAATATAIGLVAYSGVDKMITDNIEQTLKSGMTLNRIAADSNVDLDHAFYAVADKKDFQKYKGIYGDQLRREKTFFGLPGGIDPRVHIFQKEIPIIKDIKAPSTKEAQQIFKETFGSDPKFMDGLVNTWGPLIDRDSARSLKGVTNLNNKKDLNNAYELFNRLLVYHDDPDFQGHIDHFYDTLKSKGFGALLDINDYKYSGYDTNRPMIVFDMDAVSQAICKEIDNQEIDSAQAKAMMGLYGKQYLKEYMPAFAGIMAAGAVGAHVKEQNLKEIEKKNSRKKKTSDIKEEAS